MILEFGQNSRIIVLKIFSIRTVSLLGQFREREKSKGLAEKRGVKGKIMDIV